MQLSVLLLFTLILVGLMAGCSLLEPAATSVSYDAAPEYPESPKGDVVEQLHGVSVADPYRWLEDSDSAETREWIEAQNRVTFDFLETLPGRDAMRSRLTELWNYEKHGVPRKRGKNYFFSRNDGLQNQSPIYVTQRLDHQARLLIDPNKLSEDGTTSVAQYAPSRDGKLLAYAISEGGSDWRTVRFRNVETGEDLPDTLEWVKFSGLSWAEDNSGIVYNRYPKPAEGDDKLQQVNSNQQVYFHKLGTTQSEDYLIYERPDQPQWGFGCHVTEDGNYLVAHVWQGTHRENNLFYRNLKSGNDEMVELLTDFQADYSMIGNAGPVFWLFTDDNAPRGRVVAIDTSVDKPEFLELIPESEDTLEGVSFIGGHFVARYLRDARTVVRVHDVAGALVRELELPGIGSADGFGGRPEDPETFFAFTSFTSPSAIYRYDVLTDETTQIHAPDVGIDPNNFVVEQVFYASKDGTKVPMFLVHKKGLPKDGQRPVMLYGYGGFNIPQTPHFSVTALLWLELGGVYAVANLRGGGEYGEAWHKAGTLDQKQNVFDDFIAAAEWLIDNDYTSAAKIGISGGSNGGLLVGACMTQRPDLFGACIPSVGVFDMLRFHKFTIGWAWVSDYGSPDEPDDFKTLMEYSPLHNVRDGGCYPPTLICTGDHDDRVVPLHSFKYAARLQAAQKCTNPVLIRIDTRAGHGAGKSTEMVIDEISDKIAFLARSLELELPAAFRGESGS